MEVSGRCSGMMSVLEATVSSLSSSPVLSATMLVREFDINVLHIFSLCFPPNKVAEQEGAVALCWVLHLLENLMETEPLYAELSGEALGGSQLP